MDSDEEMVYTGISVLIWLGVNIAMTVLGTIYKDDCPDEPYVPIYMIVGGIAQVLMCLLIPLKLFFRKVYIAVQCVLFTFSVCWLIAGGIWFFRMYKMMPHVTCNSVVLYFTFTIVIINFFLCGLFGSIAIVAVYAGLKEARTVQSETLPT